MPRLPRVFAPGLLYHVIARGNRGEPTFLGPEDYEDYLSRLARVGRRDSVTLYAYCLMPNHVHLLAACATRPLARPMQSLQQSYTQRFNRVHGTVGHVFQGRYKAIVCDRDRYLLALVRYIHLNAVRAGLVRAPEEYPYSGHGAYLRARPDGLVDPRFVLRLLGGPRAYRRFVVTAEADGHEPPYHHASAPGEAQGRPPEPPPRSAPPPAGPRPPAAVPVDVAVASVARELGVDPERLRGPDRTLRACRARTLLAQWLVCRLGYRVTDVARTLRRRPATIGLALTRLANRPPGNGASGPGVVEL